jgi:DNA-binding transcriptional MerR regulator
MMNTSYSIPESAKLTGIPEHAIREYVKQFADVLPEPETKGDSGRATVRRYPDAALDVFRSIRKLKDEGLDTAQIRSALLEGKPADAYSEVASLALHVSAEADLASEDPNETEWTAGYVEATHWDSPSTESDSECKATQEASEAPECPTDEPAEEARWETDTQVHAPWQPPQLTVVETSATGEEWTTPAATEAAEEWTAEAAVEVTSTLDGTAVEEDLGTAHWITEDAASVEATEATTESSELAPLAVEHAAAEAVPVAAEVREMGGEPFHPLFTNLNDGLRQLRQIMDENTQERESLRSEREALIADTTAKHAQIEELMATVSAQQEKIGGLETALGALMAQCDQQLQAIRSALGQS